MRASAPSRTHGLSSSSSDSRRIRKRERLDPPPTARRLEVAERLELPELEAKIVRLHLAERWRIGTIASPPPRPGLAYDERDGSAGPHLSTSGLRPPA
jgi:hypothetical protein